MPRDPRIDTYIDKAQPFAQPILRHLRAAVHAACPEVEERIKWSSPAFDYRGQPLCSMAAFKAHAAFGFWKGALVTGDAPAQLSAMGQFGRLAAIADLPDDATLAALIGKAMALNDAGVKLPRTLKHPKPELPLPDDLAAALAVDPAAQATYDAFPPGQRREYIEWITDAKRPETRAKRVGQAAAWMAEGKRRNWKYEAC